MKILVTGANGQVGWELARSLSVLGEVRAVDRRSFDLSKPDTLRQSVIDSRPDVIVNAAAYTAVDKAESEEAQATTINGEAVGELARAARECGALFVHYSTDYVFDGSKQGAYLETDDTCAVNAYGRSKLAGELATSEAGGDWLVFRTTWVYAARGNNFMRTMLRLAASREELRVVGDQVGAPTWARNIADATAQIVSRAMAERRAGTFRSGLFNLSAGGSTSWQGYADAIIAEARRLQPDTEYMVKSVVPIRTDEYPLPAPRPANSVLSNDALQTRFGVRLPDWRVGMSLCLADLLAAFR
jgi:dTDP-4-dehydrorhamnose reductase